MRQSEEQIESRQEGLEIHFQRSQKVNKVRRDSHLEISGRENQGRGSFRMTENNLKDNLQRG